MIKIFYISGDEHVLGVDSGDSHRLVNVDLSRGNMYTLKW